MLASFTPSLFPSVELTVASVLRLTDLAESPLVLFGSTGATDDADSRA